MKQKRKIKYLDHNNLDSEQVDKIMNKRVKFPKKNSKVIKSTRTQANLAVYNPNKPTFPIKNKLDKEFIAIRDFYFEPAIINSTRIHNEEELAHSDLEKWKQIALQEAANGASLFEIKAILGISGCLYRRLMAGNKEFRDFIITCKKYARCWWYKTGREGLNLKGFNSQLFAFQMKNKYGWSDKVEIDPGDKSVSLIQQQIAALASGKESDTDEAITTENPDKTITIEVEEKELTTKEK